MHLMLPFLCVSFESTRLTFRGVRLGLHSVVYSQLHVQLCPAAIACFDFTWRVVFASHQPDEGHIGIHFGAIATFLKDVKDKYGLDKVGCEC